MNRALHASMLVLVALLFCSPAHAETIPLTGGVFDAYVSSAGGVFGPLSLTGERGFTFDGYTYGLAGFPVTLPMPPGSTFTFTFEAGGGDLPGTATLDGMTFVNIGGSSSDASGLVKLATGPLLLPGVLSAPAQLTTPFSLEFTLFGNGEHIMTGTGVATILLGEDKGFGVPSWRVAGIHAEIGSSPVPEPATMTLLGSGLAFIGMQRRRRAHRR